MNRPIRWSAGALVWRPAPGGSPTDLQVLLVHRPRHDDWTVPKGTVERGEVRPVTAVREVEEETGVTARLGVPLLELEYEYAPGRMKNVAYWAATAVRGDADAYEPNKEIDGVAWVPLTKAAKRLSYDSDRSVLDAFAERLSSGALDARTLLVVRHATARPRQRWRKDPLARPLSAEGKNEARGLRPLLAAYGVHHLRSSAALRCAATLSPYADALHRPIVLDHRLDEPREGGPEKKRPVAEAMAEAVDHKRPVVVCGHRPVLPRMLEVVGVDASAVDADPLPAAGLVVVHHRRGEVRAIERHDPH
ncbi:NUDIX hydrolase [Mumia sp. ZJ1417]|uniref:NUDIX hydrolase n=1 Tax=unclassified Mumia TaxID=2621872 RepID=UPI00141F7A69|nr:MULTISPECIES: NUDIX hydrolase [unclassified Mumia]QMW66856.1 NUDIX hydrolase [Mumia sp. ZJ1417]